MQRALRTFLPPLAAALVVLAVLSPTALRAQQGSLGGTVTDVASGAPISGATILIGGTTLVGVTNDQGEYNIVNVRPGLALVSVQRIGYKAQGDSVMIAAGQRTTRDFRLAITVSTLSEVVVTGVTGNTQRKAQAALVASLPVGDLARTAPVTNVNEILQSRLPGVSVNTGSGSVGASRSIRIRGAASISLSNQPLIFIDGIRVDESQNTPGVGGQRTDRLNDINPDDIESIEVVKGPAAATLYGADASSGVIQIITKKGKLGSNTFQQSLRIDVATSENLWTPPSNFGTCSTNAVLPTSVNPLCRGQAVGTLVSDNPLERVNAFQKGSMLNVGWTGRGGGQNYGYFLSASSDKSEGTLPSNTFERISFRSNVNIVPNAKFKVDLGFNILQSDTRLPENDNNIYGWLGGALLGSPTTRRDDGNPGQDGWFGFARQYDAISAIEKTVSSRRAQGNVTVNYQPIDWFTNRFTIGADLARDEIGGYFPKNDVGQYTGNLNTGDNDQTRIGVDRFTIDYIGNVRRSFGDQGQWGANFSGGLQSIITRRDNANASGFGFTTNAANSVSNASTRTGTQSFSEEKALGYIGELQLSSQDRRFVQFGVRVDKNSSFGQRAGQPAPQFVLPKVGASWVLSEESFFEPMLGVLSQVRLRAAWGTTGRSPNPGASLTTFSAAPYAITGSQDAGAIPNNPGNDSLKAERGEEFEFGIDLSTFNDRVSMELTYFDKTTKDLLLSVPLPPSLGFLNDPFANIGEVKNSGLELTLRANVIQRANFAWESSFGGNTLNNKLVSLGDVNAFYTLNRFTEGYQLGSFVTKTIRDINEATGVVTVADTLEVYGKLLPTLEWNWSNTVTVAKNFRVSALLDSKTGHNIYNNTDFFRETQLVRSDNRLDPDKLSPRERLRRYGNPTAGQPAFVQENGKSTTVNEVREAYIQSGDFVRLREVSLTYSMPSSMTNRLGGFLTGGSFTLAVQNLALWTDYEGADPEVVSNAGGNFTRTDFLTQPNPRTIVFKTNFIF